MMSVSWMTICAAAVIVGLILLKIYLKLKTGVCRSTKDLSGKTAVVTGSNTGIGYYTALDLADRNARVILACRDVNKAKAAAQSIKEETGNTNVEAWALDVSSMKSVRQFAEQFRKTESHLDILVNNAGCVGLHFSLTDDGIEKTWATNHFGHFLLTNLLIDIMKKSAPSRIVNVSSVAAKFSRQQIDFEHINSEAHHNIGTVYFHSKRANIMFTRELARKLEGTGVTANVLHPGTVRSELLRYQPVYVKMIANLSQVFFKTTEEGAQTSIHCAVCDDVEGVTGRYFEDCSLADEGSLAKDDAAAKKLWELSETLTGLTKSDL